MEFRLKTKKRVKGLSEVLTLSMSAVKDVSDGVGVVFRKQQKTLFATEGSSGGIKWTRLSERYRRWKKKRFPRKKILTLSGKMKKGLTSKSDPKHVNCAFASKKGFIVIVGVQSKIAGYHEQGTLKMPARRILQRTSAQGGDLIVVANKRLIKHVLRAIKALDALKGGR